MSSKFSERTLSQTIQSVGWQAKEEGTQSSPLVSLGTHNTSANTYHIAVPTSNGLEKAQAAERSEALDVSRASFEHSLEAGKVKQKKKPQALFLPGFLSSRPTHDFLPLFLQDAFDGRPSW